MTGLKLEDPTVDVNDIEKYRLAFLMQFFVQHKPRFRFPRIRLQDLYQRVIKDPEPTAFCDVVARILRFLSHGDPEISIDHVDQALDRFTVDKRTSYRIQMQRHRNGKPIHQLSPEARAALLDNLIESVYDEQPDFNFTTTGFSTGTGASCAPGLPNGVRSSNGATGEGLSNNDPDAGTLFGGSASLGLNDGSGVSGDYNEQEDVNVLIKAGQDAQGCSYYYMDDLRLYRERPQSGISSQWDVAVGPTAAQWQAFISSLSRNEKEYDLYYFLQHELFELVKESLDVYELHAPNSELDTACLRAKEANELAELRRLKGLSSSKTSGSNTDETKLPLTTVTSLGSNGPKSASPAFSGGHGTCGVGSAGSSTSGAPLTPSSARTPTSAPPATALLPNGYFTPSSAGSSAQTGIDSAESRGQSKCESNIFTTRSSGLSLTNPPTTWSSDARTAGKPRACPNQPNGDISLTANVPLKPEDGSGDMRSPLIGSDLGVITGKEQHHGKSSPSATDLNNLVNTATDSSNPNDSSGLETSHMERELTATMNPETHGKPSPNIAGDTATQWTPSHSRGSVGPSSVSSTSQRMGALSSDGTDLSSNLRSSSGLQIGSSITTTVTSPTIGLVNSSTTTPNKLSTHGFEPSARPKDTLSDPSPLRPNLAAVRPQGPNELLQIGPPPQPTSLPMGDSLIPNTLDCAFSGKGSLNKSHINPATALVPPMVGIPDGSATLTQEQWENRKSKIAQLEKIHSTLSKSKSASTPGAVAAAAGVVLQQQQQQLQQNRLQAGSVGAPPLPPNSLTQSPGSLPHTMGVNTPVGFGPSSYSASQRPIAIDPYGNPRPVMMTGGAPNEMAQREWDRLCMDYQREKGEPPGPRFHPSCRQPVMYDPNGCPILSADPSTSPHGNALPPGALMMPSQMMMDHLSCGPNGRHFGPHIDGPPVVMVPPNNTNLTSASSTYPPPSAASGPLSTNQQHFRPMPSTISGYPGPEQIPMGMVPPGHKRPYHGSSNNEPWGPSNAPHSMMSQVPVNEPNMFPGSIQPAGPMPGTRIGPITSGGMGSSSMGPNIPVSLSNSIASTTPCSTNNVASNPNAPSTTGRSTSGTGKTSGKKRKTAAANRAAASALNATNASPAGTLASQPPSNYGKSSGPGAGLLSSINATKATYPATSSTYMTDNSGLIGLTHPHRSVYMSQSVTGVPAVHPQQQSPGPLSHYPGGGPDTYFTHYPDMIGAPPSVGRSVAAAPPVGPESRRSLTPKCSDTFTMGPSATPTGGNNAAQGSVSGGRLSNCQPGMLLGNNVGGSYPNSSMMHPYLQSPDGTVASSVDASLGMRSTQGGSYTQHLTSASLASLARLSQMSGPEGPPYAPGSSSNSSMSSGPGTVGGSLSTLSAGPNAAYSSRGNPMPAYPNHPPHHHQQPDMSNAGIGPGSHQMPPSQLLRSHSVSGGLKSHMNHDPDQAIVLNQANHPPQPNSGMHQKFGPQGYHSQQSLPAGMLSTQPTTPTQQPPSIQVNNTFFNAQLNVQQMNYQHVSAPGSTGQMQIHFVQQQQATTQSHEPQGGHRSSSRPPDPSRMSSTGNVTTTPSGGYTTGNANVTTTASTSASGPEYYHSGSEMGMMHRLPPNYSNEAAIKPDQLTATLTPCTNLSTTNNTGSGGPPVSGYGNTSIQITPKTPHTIQYLPTVAPNTAIDGQQQHNAQYTPSGRPGSGRLNVSGNTVSANTSTTSGNNTTNNVNTGINSSSIPYGSTDPELDQNGISVRPAGPGPGLGSSGSLHAGNMYPNSHHPPGAPQPTTGLSTAPYHQSPSINQMKMATSQGHPSNRTLPNGPWTGSDVPFDLHNPIPGSFNPGMDSAQSLSMGMVARSASGSGPGMKSTALSSVGYPPIGMGFPSESMDPCGDHISGPFMSDPTGIGRSSGASNSAQYCRPQPSGRHAPYDQNAPQQQTAHQQHVYRQQQQYNHTQTTQQQQQQHQMFMSSSNYMSDGPGGPSGQVQFVMSASSSSLNASSSTTMQNCSSGMVMNETMGINQSSSGNPDSKQPQYDHSKRTFMMPSGLDESKPNHMTLYTGPPGSQAPHMLQSQIGPGRTVGRPLSNTGMSTTPPVGMDPHFTSPYHSAGSFPGPNFAQVSSMGPPYGDKSSRELIGTSQSASLCDVTSAAVSGLPQVTYQSSLLQ